MSAHTPGPWKAVSLTACAEIGEIMEIAEVAYMRVIPAAGGWPTAGQPEDDARLIAAAPELLQALQALVDLSGSEGLICGQRVINKARAAIDKATGGAT